MYYKYTKYQCKHLYDMKKKKKKRKVHIKSFNRKN